MPIKTNIPKKYEFYSKVFKNIRTRKQISAVGEALSKRTGVNLGSKATPKVINALIIAAEHKELSQLERRSAVYALEKIHSPQISQFMLKMTKHEDIDFRRSAFRHFSKSNNKIAIRGLSELFFDDIRSLRNSVCNELLKKKGYNYMIRLVNLGFPINGPKIPSKFFTEKNLNFVGLKNDPRKGVKSMGFYRGAKVLLIPSRYMDSDFNGKRKIPLMGHYENGVIEINADINIVPKKFRQATIEHEFGENWGHMFGQALMLKNLERQGLLKEYWDFVKDKPFNFVRNKDLQKIISTDPVYFKEAGKIIK